VPPLDVPAVDAAKALGAENVRSEITDFPEVSEFERCGISRGFRPGISDRSRSVSAGICTMKSQSRE